jgi:hypothetical protein
LPIGIAFWGFLAECRSTAITRISFPDTLLELIGQSFDSHQHRQLDASARCFLVVRR